VSGAPMRTMHADSCSPVWPIFRGTIVWINRIRGPRIDSEHPIHSSYDTAYNASYGTPDDGTDRSSGLITDRRAIGDPAWNSLSLGQARQRKRKDKGKRYHGVKFHKLRSPHVQLFDRKTCVQEKGGLEAFIQVVIAPSVAAQFVWRGRDPRLGAYRVRRVLACHRPIGHVTCAGACCAGSIR
jgi:hypothetical protein